MKMLDYLKTKFGNGLDYEDAVHLCLAFYCSADNLPIVLKGQTFSATEIAETFTALARQGYIKNFLPYKAVTFGAHYHALEDIGHWIEVQASLLKLNTEYSSNRVQELIGEGGD